MRQFHASLAPSNWSNWKITTKFGKRRIIYVQYFRALGYKIILKEMRSRYISPFLSPPDALRLISRFKETKKYRSLQITNSHSRETLLRDFVLFWHSAFSNWIPGLLSVLSEPCLEFHPHLKLYASESIASLNTTGSDFTRLSTTEVSSFLGRFLFVFNPTAVLNGTMSFDNR